MKKLFAVWLLLAALTSHVTALVHADAVLDWNQYAATAIVSPPPTGAGKPAGIGLVDLAIVHNAIYDAVNAIAGYPFEPYEVIPTVTMPASSEAAVATAGHSILVALFPAQQTDLDTKYATSLAQIPDGPGKTNGIAVGQQLPRISIFLSPLFSWPVNANSYLLVFLRFLCRVTSDLLETCNDFLRIDAILKEEHAAWNILEILFANVKACRDGDDHVRTTGTFELHDFPFQIIWSPKSDDL